MENTMKGVKAIIRPFLLSKGVVMKRKQILCRLMSVSLILFLQLAQAQTQESDELSVADSA
jgi:hypothetical protein